jgi:hypothetical protein
VAPPKLLAGTRKFIERSEKKESGFSLEIANRNLLAAYRSGVLLVTGSAAGECAGDPRAHGTSRDAVVGASRYSPRSSHCRRRLRTPRAGWGVGDRMGSIRKRCEATFLLVDGNPTKDIAATERTSTLFFKGERIRRQDLFDDESK